MLGKRFRSGLEQRALAQELLSDLAMTHRASLKG